MYFRKLLAVLFMSFLSIGIILSGCTKQEEVEKVVVPEHLSDPLKIDGGYISGTIIGDVDNPIRAYRGIPYAAPPVGDLRWKPPQPAASWDEIRQCTEFTKTPPQTGMPGLPQTPQSEDCLYLNVMTPAKTVGEAIPVMVWLHGGGYSSGSGNDQLCNLHRLPQHGVVVVTVTMRLNTLGLLAHPLLTAESPHHSSGNYMFLDMIATLKWVKRNISVFGGNPDNVTIFGESGGGSKVSTLMASPLAKGLFHRAICESGSSVGGFLNGKKLNEMEELGVKLFTRLGVDNADDPLKAARALPFEKVMEARDAMLKEFQGDRRSMGLDDSTIDGWFLPKTPLELFQVGEYNAVPLITIANLGEITGPGGLLLPQLIPAYVNMHELQNKAGVNGYAAIFDQVPSKWRAEGAVSTHAMEVLYVFGDYDNRTGWWPFMHGLAKQSGAKDPNDPGLTEADRRVSEAMMKMWTQFARTGDPNVEGINQWPAYNKEEDKYMYISDPLEIKTGFSEIKPESDEIQYLQGPRNVEDLQPLADTQWLVTSGLNGEASNTDNNGHIYLINHKKKTFEELFPGKNPSFDHDTEMFNACPGPINPNDFSAHGIGLQQQSSGLYRLYMINHGEREAIEAFKITVKDAKPAISWVGCVLLPEDLMANSVAILPDGGFLTTKYFDPTVPNSIRELIQGKITGGVYEWHPGGNVKAVHGTELSGANGIVLSPDNEWVYVTAFGTREIGRFNRTKSPITMEKVKIDIMPDNIRWGDDGMLYTVGNNYVPPEECKNPPCRTGWSIFSIHPETLKLKRITGVDQTAAQKNGTTALAVGNEIWVGTFSGDKIGYFPKP